MIRVVHLVNKLGAGGAERQLYYITKYMNKDLFSHEILTLMGEGQMDAQFRKEGVKVTNFNLSGFSPSIALLNKLFIIHQYIHAQNFEVLHAWLFHPNFYAAIVKLFSPKVQLIVSKQGRNFWYSKFHFLANRFVYRVADLIMVNSLELKASILRYMPSVEGKIRNIPNVVVLPDVVAPAPELASLKEAGKFIVGIVGRFVPEKEPLVALRALARLRLEVPEIVFVFLGEGQLLDSCKAYVKETGLEKYVNFVGYRADVFKWYRGFDVYLLPSSSESLPNTLLEALAAGLPCVATAVGAIPEIIKDGYNGMLIKPGDWVPIVDALKKLYFSVEVRMSMGSCAAQKAKEFSLDNMKAYEDLYLEVANSKTGRF